MLYPRFIIVLFGYSALSTVFNRKINWLAGWLAGWLVCARPSPPRLIQCKAE